MTTFIRINFQQEQDKRQFLALLQDKTTEFYIYHKDLVPKPISIQEWEKQNAKSLSQGQDRQPKKENRIQFNKSKMAVLNQSRISLRMDYPVIDREAKILDGKAFWLEIKTEQGTTIYLNHVQVEAGNNKQVDAIFTYCEDKDQDIYNELTVTMYEKKTNKLVGQHGTFFEVKLDQEPKKDDDSFTLKSRCNPCNIL